MCDQAGGLTESSPGSPRSGDPGNSDKRGCTPGGGASASAFTRVSLLASLRACPEPVEGMQRRFASSSRGLRCAPTPFESLRTGLATFWQPSGLRGAANRRLGHARGGVLAPGRRLPFPSSLGADSLRRTNCHDQPLS